jgi:hypothetical protein
VYDCHSQTCTCNKYRGGKRKRGVYPRRFAVSADRAASVASHNKRPGHELSTGYPQCCTKTQSINNVNITPIMKEVIEYSKDQASVGDLEELISKVPAKDSMDWKLISGVLMNSLVEWVAEDKEERIDLIRRLQGDVGYILKRMGLTM